MYDNNLSTCKHLVPMSARLYKVGIFSRCNNHFFNNITNVMKFDIYMFGTIMEFMIFT